MSARILYITHLFNEVLWRVPVTFNIELFYSLAQVLHGGSVAARYRMTRSLCCKFKSRSGTSCIGRGFHCSALPTGSGTDYSAKEGSHVFRTFSDQIHGRTCETSFLPVPLNKTLHASVCCGMTEGSTPSSDQRGADEVLKFVGYDCSKAAARKICFL